MVVQVSGLVVDNDEAAATSHVGKLPPITSPTKYCGAMQTNERILKTVFHR